MHFFFNRMEHIQACCLSRILIFHLTLNHVVPRTISSVLLGLKVKNFATVCPRFDWQRKTASTPVGVNPPL
jgi:hypothetical protein